MYNNYFSLPFTATPHTRIVYRRGLLEILKILLTIKNFTNPEFAQSATQARRAQDAFWDASQTSLS